MKERSEVSEASAVQKTCKGKLVTVVEVAELQSCCAFAAPPRPVPAEQTWYCILLKEEVRDSEFSLDVPQQGVVQCRP